MPPVSRAGVDNIATGHLCDTTALISTSGASSKVFTNGSRTALQGTQIQVHTFLVGQSCIPHAVVVNAGSSKVFAEGIPVARIGDSADAGSIIAGSGTVSAGG
jgi:uncharacterized Zn-binding protein involved in type VI secretion